MIIILDNIRSAHNVGSIIRTCDAFGIKEVYLCGMTPGPKNSKFLKTALGAEQGIKFTTFRTTTEAVEKAKENKYFTVGLEISTKAIDIDKINARNKTIALVVGNEVSGVAPEVLNACDAVAQIPMRGLKESLNVSVAFGIAAFVLSAR